MGKRKEGFDWYEEQFNQQDIFVEHRSKGFKKVKRRKLLSIERKNWYRKELTK